MMRRMRVAVFLVLGCGGTESPTENNECDPTVDGVCDDGNPCTRDRCVDGKEGTVCDHEADDELVPSDGIYCTEDACVGGKETHTPDDGKCDACDGQTCDLAAGQCVDGDPLPLEDDMNPCTEEDCLNGMTTHIPILNPDNPCLVCAPVPDEPDTYTWEIVRDAVDDDPCTQDLCTEDPENPGKVIVSNPPVDTSDGVDCTVDACDLDTGDITHEPDDAACQDDLFCNGAETCDETDGCLDGPDPDDYVFCTVCDEGASGPVFTPDDSLCAGGTCDPDVDCILPTGSVIVSEFLALAPGGAIEFVELRNVTIVDVNLAFYEIEIGGGAPQEIRSATAPDDPAAPAWLPAGGHVFGVANPADPADIPEGATFVWGAAGSAPGLADAGDVIRVIGNDGSTKDEVDFTPFVTDPPAALGALDFPGLSGVSTQMDPAGNFTTNDLGSWWCVSFPSANTAGAPNRPCDAFVINEVHCDADEPGASGDTDDARTFVEIAGPGGGPLGGARLVGVEGQGASAGDDQEPDVTIAAGLRMPLAGFYVIADGLPDGTTLVANADVVVPDGGDPENGPDALQLVSEDGDLLDAVGYGAVEAAADTTRGLATLEGAAADDVAPLDVGFSLARDEASADTDDNSADFHLDPTPSPGEANAPVAPDVLGRTRDDGLATASTTVRMNVVDLANTSTSGPIASFGENDAECTFPVAGDASIIECVAPPNAGGADMVDLVLANPPEVGGSDTLASGWTYTGVLNETGDADEADSCTLIGPASTATTAGVATEALLGELLEAGLTDASSSPAAGVVAEVGFGPTDTDPTADGAWIFYSADTDDAWDFAADEDRFSDALLIATPGTLAYTYRFSFDFGQNFTYCDLDGAGSDPGLDFDPSALGALDVTP